MSTEVVEETKHRTDFAKMYRVLVHNDDKSPIDLVVAIIIRVFKKEPSKAADLAKEAHNKGLALVTVEPLEHAEFHVDQAHSYARTAKIPLKFTYEPED